MHTSILTILEAEHDTIESVLDALQRSLHAEPDWELWAGVLHFLREYADAFHHAKEEDLLFPRMVERGVPSSNGPIGCMLQEHDTARELVGRMGVAIEQRKPEAMRAAAQEYIPLLRLHIAKENDILFPMARRTLSAADDDELGRRCAELVASTPQAEALRDSAQRLLERAFSAKN